MDTASIFPLAAGTALNLRTTLYEAEGRAPISYDEPPPIEAAVWPGSGRLPSFPVAVAWADATAGEIDLSIAASQTAALPSGRYRGQVIVTDPALGRVVAWAWAIDLEAGPGDEPEPASYCDYDDLRAYARGWLATLQGPDVEAGFAQERGRARDWLDDLILAAGPPAGRAGLGDPGYGAIAWGVAASGPSTWLREQLDAGLLVRRRWVVEATAKMALAYICEGQIGLGDAGQQYATLGRMYRTQADAIAMTSWAELTATPGGPPTLRLNLGVRSFG